MKACCPTSENCTPKSLPTLALVGNPNAGKTTLFNLLTGSRQRTGNWPGVTVERKTGHCQVLEQDTKIVDLPGTYSLDSGNSSEDELIARQYVQQNPDHLYINVLDASTLERGLYLTLQLRELGIPIIVLLNRMDIAEQRNMLIDSEQLAKQLGCPVLSTSLKQEGSLDKLQQALCQFSTDQLQDFVVPYQPDVEQTISQLQQQGMLRSQAIAALNHPQADTAELRQQLEQKTDEPLDFLLADARFEHATQMARQTSQIKGKVSRTWSDKLDRWALGNWTGLAIFLTVMYLLFLFSINLGSAFIDFFDLSVQALLVDGGRQSLSAVNTPEWLITLLADGIGGGIQVVATFIPVIAALYLFLTLLEESGYMSRAAFVMDRFMRKLGVSGKAFVPLIVGFGCNVPAIMASRTLDSQRERIIAVLMAPFMSCGARLAVYALFASAFFGSGGQNIVFLLYLTGILFAILTALVMHKTLLSGTIEHFMMEMPTYQVPQWRNVLINTWSKLKGFLIGAGQIIVIVVALINIANSLGTDGSFGHQNTEKSVLSATAKTITPVFEPMGISEDNWPATVGIISGLLAKEVVVGTLDALYSQLANNDAPAEESTTIPQQLKEAALTIPANLNDALSNLNDPLGFGSINEEPEVQNGTINAMVERFDGRIGAFAYLLFILMYFPCIAATGAMKREIGTRWTLLGVAWTTGLAYASAVLFYQIATIMQHPLQSLLWVLVIVCCFATAVWMFYLKGKQLNPLESHNPLLHSS